MEFDRIFAALSGREPFPWQRRLFLDFQGGRIPTACDIPTGLGKTSVIAVWLLALAHQARSGTVNAGLFPRRLVYVVNRRTIVDQATKEAQKLREALETHPELLEVNEALRSLAARPSDNPLAISTLRGQFADNAEWRDDPSRPAIVIGTVDMIGSRLLFSGYGRGFKSRPIHAAFLAQDVLMVHDEAHLEPAFQDLVEAIRAEQSNRPEISGFHVLSLTATSRTDSEVFGLSEDEDLLDPRVLKRLLARKRLRLFPVGDAPDHGGKVKKSSSDQPRKTEFLVDSVVERALRYRDSGRAVLVFLRRVEDVEKVQERLDREKLPVDVLTGTLRGFEREERLDSPVFRRFLPESDRGSEGVPAEGTVYLVCTSAGEVGINLSADHLVCDLTPFDSMAQRLGRVNRFGDGDAEIDVVVSDLPDEKDPEVTAYDMARLRTYRLLSRLRDEDGVHDASPEALRLLPTEERLAAFSPRPFSPRVDEVLFDSWSLTSVRSRLPGRPAVADWLHGISSWETPETRVAWREDVEIFGVFPEGSRVPGDLLDDFPLKPLEFLSDRTDRVFRHLSALARKHPEAPVWVVDDDAVDTDTLTRWIARGKEVFRNRAVLLPPSVGGLRDGLLCDRDFDPQVVYDISARWLDEHGNPRRSRIWDDERPPAGMRLIRTVDTRPDSEDEDTEAEPVRRFWHWYVHPRSADDDGSRMARAPQTLEAHLRAAESHARALTDRIGLGETEATAVTLAARWHDLGKRRQVWQRSIGNQDYPRLVLAKSGCGMRPVDLGGYRHELGSLLDLRTLSEFDQIPKETRELVLHLIAAHHGRSRPHFPPEEASDPEHSEADVASLVGEMPGRFARLQRRYGRWGLAYLESLVRAADALASQEETS